MVATVADYRVLDSGFRLSLQGGDGFQRSLGLDLDEGYVAGTNIARPILQFMVRAFQDNSRLVVVVNGSIELDNSNRIVPDSNVVLDREFDASPIRTYYVVIGGERFFPSAGNKLIFAVNADGSDDVLVESVVLWHQRRVAT